MGWFEDNILTAHGTLAIAWRDSLSTLIEQLANKWQLSELQEHPNLTYNYIMTGMRGQQPILLKIGIDPKSIANECTALTAFASHKIVKLIDQDLEHGAILMHRLIPGDSLISLFPDNDQHAMQIACEVIADLHRAPIPTAHHFESLDKWLSVIDQDWQLPYDKLSSARTLKRQLLGQTQRQVLLHGDYHSDNVSRDHDTWLAIDPKGVIGDQLYDLSGCLISTPRSNILKHPDPLGILQSRTHVIANYFKVPAAQISQWTYVQFILSLCWSLEDRQPIEDKLPLLGIISQLI